MNEKRNFSNLTLLVIWITDIVFISFFSALGVFFIEIIFLKNLLLALFLSMIWGFGVYTTLSFFLLSYIKMMRKLRNDQR